MHPYLILVLSAFGAFMAAVAYARIQTSRPDRAPPARPVIEVTPAQRPEPRRAA